MAEHVEHPMGKAAEAVNRKLSDQPTNGTNGAHTTNGSDAVKTSRFDPAFTDAVINATGPKANPRLRKVMALSLIHI